MREFHRSVAIGHLIELVKELIRARKIGDAREIHEILEKTKLSQQDPSLLLRIGMEIFFQEPTFDSGFFRFMQAYSQKCPSEAQMILRETVNYYLKYGKLAEAYEHLSGYLSSPPFSSSPHFYAMAAIICDQISRREKRPVVTDKQQRKACLHFETYIEMGGLDWKVLRIYSAILKRRKEHTERVKLLARLRAKDPFNFELALELQQASELAPNDATPPSIDLMPLTSIFGISN